MDDLLTPADVELAAVRAGISMAELCRRARIGQSIFTRWKSGETSPTFRNYRRIREVVAAISAPKPRKRAAAQPVAGTEAAE